MDSATAAALDAIDRQFYRTVGPEFSASRSRLHAGIREAFEGLDGPRTVLDAGCGDGRVGLAWAAGDLAIPWSAGCRYLGMDRSRELLNARAPWPAGLEAIEADLAGSWPEGPFDVVCTFSAIHHVPGRKARREVLARIAGALAPGGTWIVSVWQFLHRERYRRRIVDWAEAGVDPAALEPGDLLLDWRRGPRALRYVHHYSPDELAEDCAIAGLIPERRWTADEGLGLYLRGRPAT
jgi:SAM-dependent methyltransferase